MDLRYFLNFPINTDLTFLVSILGDKMTDPTSATINTTPGIYTVRSFTSSKDISTNLLLEKTHTALTTVGNEILPTIKNLKKPDIHTATLITENGIYSSYVLPGGNSYTNAMGDYSVDLSRKNALKAVKSQKVVIVEQHNGTKLVVLCGSEIPNHELLRLRQLIPAGVINIPSASQIGDRKLGKILFS